MGLLDSIKPFVPALQIVDAIKNGDFKALLGTVSQLALTFATGGAGALTGPLMSALGQFGSQALAAGLGNKIVSMVGQEFIQAMGEKMGLPQSAIDAAQAVFCESCGDKAGARQNFKEAGHLGEGRFWDRHTVSGGERAESKQFLSAILGFAQGTPAGRGIADNTAAGLQDGIKSAFQDIFDQLFNQEVQKKSKELKEGGDEDANVDAIAAGGVADKLGIDASSFLMQFAMLMGTAVDNKTNDMMKLAREMNQKSGELSSIGGDDKQFNAELSKKNSELGQMSGMLQGLSKEIETLMNALKTALDSIGNSQSAMLRG